MQYRKDGRTTEQFAKDIKQCHRTERSLMELYVKWLNSRIRNNIPYTFEDNGVDNSGELLPDNKVTTAADFLLLREGHRSKLIDIKFCREERAMFHLKVGQVKSYVKNDVAIVNYMASNTDNRRFCIITPKELAWMLKYSERIEFQPWGYKECLRCYNKDFEWYHI